MNKLDDIKEPYVLTIVHARLGNVMFQLAAGKKYADDNGLNFYWAPLLADENLNYKRYIETNRLLDTLFRNFKESYINTEIKLSRSSDLHKIDTQGNVSVYKYGFKQNAFNYSPIPLVENVILFGQFYNAKYLDRNVCLDMFKCPVNIQNEIMELYGDLSETTCIHVRRGDFEKGDGLLLDKDYYINCIKKFPLGSKFIVISENIEWCKESLRVNGYNIVFSEAQSTSSALLVDFFIMNSCSNIICSKSTFSWWGAFLNSREGKILYPTTIGDLLNSRVPREWIKIMVIKQEIRFRLFKIKRFFNI